MVGSTCVLSEKEFHHSVKQMWMIQMMNFALPKAKNHSEKYSLIFQSKCHALGEVVLTCDRLVPDKGLTFVGNRKALDPALQKIHQICTEKQSLCNAMKWGPLHIDIEGEILPKPIPFPSTYSEQPSTQLHLRKWTTKWNACLKYL